MKSHILDVTRIAVTRMLQRLGVTKPPKALPKHKLLTHPSFGKMRWSDEDHGWACRPKFAWGQKQSTIDLFIYVPRTSTELSAAQVQAWEKLVRDGVGLVNWTVSSVWKDVEREWGGNALTLECLLRDAVPVAGILYADANLELDINVGDLLGGHSFVLSLGPEPHMQSASLSG